MLALLLTACGQRAAETPPEEAPPAETAAPEVPESPPDLPKGAAALTAEEIQRVNEAFQPVIEQDGLDCVNPLTCLVSCCYRWPEELNLSAFLRHFSPGTGGGGTLDEAEFQALKAAEGWPFGEITQEQMPVPIRKYLRADVDACLKERMGITVEHLSPVPYGGPGGREFSRSTTLLYLPEYEAYYNFVSDVDPGECTSGWYSADTACLTGDLSVLMLWNRNGSWRFQSYLPLQTK